MIKDKLRADVLELTRQLRSDENHRVRHINYLPPEIDALIEILAPLLCKLGPGSTCGDKKKPVKKTVKRKK
jgi:hypothetical protein